MHSSSAAVVADVTVAVTATDNVTLVVANHAAAINIVIANDIAAATVAIIDTTVTAAPIAAAGSDY